jgi:hypothetical protein
MIYCVWYPSGGFGHFLNGVLTMHGDNFVRPNANTIKFSEDGNSHALELVAPKYRSNPDTYDFNFETSKNYSVLIDNGINDESTKFLKFFPGSKVIKICYNDDTWPVVAKTMFDKAMRSSIQKELPVDIDAWETNADWAVREKYFLFLRDNSLRHAWRDTPVHTCLPVSSIIDYKLLNQHIEQYICKINNFESLHSSWYQVNQQYIQPINYAKDVIAAIESTLDISLTHITDLWSQAVVNYYIWTNYQVEVPANDFADWFRDTREIKKIL